MKDWEIVNGTLLLRLRDGCLYRPQASELFGQKDDPEFVHLSSSYAPLSETELRFSELTANSTICFKKSDALSVEICHKRDNIQYNVIS